MNKIAVGLMIVSAGMLVVSLREMVKGYRRGKEIDAFLKVSKGHQQEIEAVLAPLRKEVPKKPHLTLVK